MTEAWKADNKKKDLTTFVNTKVSVDFARIFPGERTGRSHLLLWQDQREIKKERKAVLTPLSWSLTNRVSLGDKGC